MNRNKILFAAAADLHIKEATVDTVVSVVDQFISFITGERIKDVFLLGDIFDVRSAQTLERLTSVKKVFQMLESFNTRVIPGNHDKTNLSSNKSYVDLYDKYIEVIDSPAAFRLNPHGEIIYRISMLPYYEEKLCIEKLENLVLNLQQTKDYHIKDILLTHVAFDGARNNDGSLVTGAIPLESVEFFDLVLTGHYHDRNQLNEKVHYIGSMYQADFGENVDKGFAIVYENLEIDYYNLEFPKYKKFKVACADKKKKAVVLRMIQSMEEETKIRVTFTGTLEEFETTNVDEFKNLGVDVRYEETETLVLNDGDLNKVKVYNKASIVKAFIDYSKLNKLESELVTNIVRNLTKHL